MKRHTYQQISEPPRQRRRRCPSAISQNYWRPAYLVLSSPQFNKLATDSKSNSCVYIIREKRIEMRTSQLNPRMCSLPFFAEKAKQRRKREKETYERISSLFPLLSSSVFAFSSFAFYLFSLPLVFGSVYSWEFFLILRNNSRVSYFTLRRPYLAQINVCFLLKISSN